MLKKIIEKICNGTGLTPFLIKFVIRKLDKYFDLSPEFLVRTNALKRPNYAYCLYYSAVLAKRLGYESLSIIEFGVAGGNGLVFLEEFGNKIKKHLKIGIEIYGFDLGSGLTEPKDFKDIKYWFKEGFYKMDQNKLKEKLKYSKLIIGDVNFTIDKFFETYNPAPIGAIFHDLDYYYSTINSFKIFDFPEKYFLPRIFNYFDDILGTEFEMYNDFSGELLAINQFNLENSSKKILLNKNLVTSNNEKWRSQIYHFHNFEHKDYNKFIGGVEQDLLNKNISLKN